jgi:phage-related protein
MGNYCSSKFKGTECGYAGSTSSCNKTASACQGMAGGSNYQRFGGFPAIPLARIRPA